MSEKVSRSEDVSEGREGNRFGGGLTSEAGGALQHARPGAPIGTEPCSRTEVVLRSVQAYTGIRCCMRV